LIIHACSEADFRKNNFSANFSSVSIFQCEGSGRSPLESGRVWVRRPDGQETLPDARGSALCLCGSSRPDGLVMRPYDYPIGLSIAFLPSRHIVHFFFSIFLEILNRVCL
jgi:hypothetical protein